MAGRSKTQTTNDEGFVQAPQLKPGEARPCEAWGCPLAGTFSHNTREGGPWWCFVHSELGPLETQGATAAIKNSGLLARYRELSTAIMRRPVYETINERNEILSVRRQILDAVNSRVVLPAPEPEEAPESFA